MTIQPKQAVYLYFARQLRAARAQVQADAEGYVAVAIAVEQLGAALGAKKTGMDAAMKVIVQVLSPLSDGWAYGHNGSPSLDAACHRVRKARNVAVHEGAMSRAVAAHAIDLTIGLEIALMTAADTYAAHAWMVPHPTVAHPWMTVAQVRSALLAGGFSTLPIQWNGTWRLVHDIDVVAYLRQAPEGYPQRQEWERKRLQEVADTKDRKLLLHRPPLVIRSLEDDVRELDLSLLRGGLPALVVCGSSDSDPGRLLGVLTSHDLLIM